jgi:hypothetical protein
LTVGIVNIFGSLGGYAGQKLTGRLTNEYHTTSIAFNVLGVGLLLAAALAFFLPKAPVQSQAI